MLKLKNINFTAIKIFFLQNVDINNVLSNKTYSGERNCKYFIGYLYDEYKLKRYI